MKAAGIVILFPLLSVVIVSLYMLGGAARWAAIVIFGTSLIAVAGLLLKKSIR